MKEHPILLSTPMVQAILEGRKTMTRRIVKNVLALELKPEFTIKLCPYGQPGDVLWVREGFRVCDVGIYAYKANFSTEILNSKFNKGVWKPSIHMPKIAARIWLKIVKVRVERLNEISEVDAFKEGMKPDGLRVECNCSKFLPHHGGDLICDDGYFFTNRQAFQSLWQALNGTESWATNPWVWVIEFEVLSTTGKPSKAQ